MFRVDFNVVTIANRLEHAARVLGDPTPLHQEIGEYMVQSTRGRFARSEAPDGTRWQAKKPATIARYLARGDGNRPKPLIGPSGRLGREIAMMATRGGVELGSALEYSGVMRGGAAKGAFGADRRGRPIPWGTIPPRVWLGISAADERNILEIADEYAGGAVGA